MKASILIALAFLLCGCGKVEYRTHLTVFPQSICSWQINIDGRQAAEGRGDTIIITSSRERCVSAMKMIDDGYLSLKMYKIRGAGLNEIFLGDEEYVAYDRTAADSGSVATVCTH